MAADDHPSLAEPAAEEPPALPTPSAAVPRPATRGVVWIWWVALIALVLFFALGTVPVEAGWFPGLRSDRVAAVWADYGDQLSGSRAGTGPRELALYAALALFLLGSAAALWLALTAHDPDPRPSPDPEPHP